MALYFKDIEITNIDNLVPQTELDITDVWFGSTNVYTVWQVYEGTLPATINANGDDMRQYQVYGAVGGVGDRTVQLFNKNATDTNNGFRQSKYIYPGGTEDSSVNWNISEYIDISGFSNITIKNANTDAPNSSVAFYDNNYIYISSVSYNRQASITAQVPSNAKFCRISVRVTNMNIAMLTPGTTTPKTYVPFGYAVDMSVKSGNIYNTDETTWSANGTILDDNGNPTSAGSHYTTNFTAAKPETTYYLSGTFRSGVSNNRIYFYDENKSWISRSAQIDTTSVRIFTTPANCKFIQIQASNDVRSTVDWNISEGTTPPNEYQPYSNTTTPIYIGDTPLEKDEYMDYQAGKVYRRTVNEFDKDNATLFNSYLRSNDLWTLSQATKCARIPVEPSTQYTLKIMTAQETFRINESDNPDLEPTSVGVQTTRIIRGTNRDSYTFTTSATAAVIVCQFNSDIATLVNGLMLVKGDTVPETYIPYLQPTDPPVPLPALPTCEGTTIVDYAGSGTAPEKVLLKYRKEGF